MTSTPVTVTVGRKTAEKQSGLRTCSSRRAALRFLAPTLLLAGLCLVGRVALGQIGLAGDDLAFHESPVELPMVVNFEIGSFDRYIWRGLRLTDGPVFQPSVTVSRGPLSVNVWGNMDLDDANNNKTELNEIDVTVGWEDTFGLCTTSVSAINYNFPNTTANTTTELNIGATFDIPAQPAISVYFDMVEAEGTYLTVGVGHTFSSTYGNPVEWELAVSTGIGWGSAEYNSLYFGVAADEATDFHVGLTFAVAMHGLWTVSQSITYSAIVSAPLREAVDADQNVAYGMTVAVNF